VTLPGARAYTFHNRRIPMNRAIYAAFAAGTIALTGCGKEGTSTAPGKPEVQAPGDRGEKRKLTVKAPGEQNVTQDQTTDFSVSINRDNFVGPITVELRDLPKGVTLVTKEMSIPDGKDSVTVTVKAAPDAPVVEDHMVKLVA